MKDKISRERLDKYLSLTSEAIQKVKASGYDGEHRRAALDFLDMVERYHSDALHFRDKGDYVTSFAAVNYAHGWLDAGARAGLFKVYDSRLFTVDDQM